VKIITVNLAENKVISEDGNPNSPLCNSYSTVNVTPRGSMLEIGITYVSEAKVSARGIACRCGRVLANTFSTMGWSIQARLSYIKTASC
jgi:hypothetical protein